MVQSAYWEANSSSASQENSRILYNSKVHHRVQKSPPLLPILSHTNSVHVLECGFINIYFNIILYLRFIFQVDIPSDLHNKTPYMYFPPP